MRHKAPLLSQRSAFIWLVSRSAQGQRRPLLGLLISGVQLKLPFPKGWASRVSLAPIVLKKCNM